MMKNIPLILVLLCSNLGWCSASKAMDDNLVLGRKTEGGKNKILVLTPSGRAKAESLQALHDQPWSGLDAAVAKSIEQAEEDRLYQQACLESAQEQHEAQQIKFAEERRNEAMRVLDEISETRNAEKQSLLSRLEELSAQETLLLGQINLLGSESEDLKVLVEKRNQILDQKTHICDVEIVLSYALEECINEEKHRLMAGEEPRELPWLLKTS